MTEADRIHAVLESDAAYDGRFFYAVKTTGVYCRPSCKSRRPNPENLLFFDTAAQAEAVGYRPCKRCRPDLAEYRPSRTLAQEMRSVIDAEFLQKAAMFTHLKGLGVSPKRAIELFKAEYGMTPGDYADELRIQEAQRLLAQTEMPVLEVAYTLGFESLSAFYALFGKAADVTPAQYRKAAAQVAEHGAAYAFPALFGTLTITAEGGAVTGVRFGGDPSAHPQSRSALTDQAAGELGEYFDGRRTAFSVPINPQGSPFQRLVWEALGEIPFGETRSYRDIARRIGRPTAARAVGMANRRNPIAILIPCHRVVGANGALTGYAAGLPMKRLLLELEQNKKTDGG